MKKNLVLYILLAFLVVMNGFFLFKHFSDTDIQHVSRRGPRIFIAKQLKFDEAQTIAFKKLDVAHRLKMEAIREAIKLAKDNLFDKLSDTTVVKQTIDVLATTISEYEANKDVETFYFFQQIRDLCDENQKVRFESIVKDALRHQPGPNGREGHKNHDGSLGERNGENRPPLGH